MEKENNIQNTPKTALSKRMMWSVFFLGFSGQIAWAVENQYYNVYMYNVISPNPLYVSYMVAITAIISTITAIIMGAVSDKVGKRRPFFIIGFCGWPLFTALFPLASVFESVLVAVTVAIIFDCIMTFFGAMASDAALTAYSADITTSENRGKVTGILELCVLLATLIAYGASGFIIEAWGYNSFFYLIGGVVAIIGIPGAFLSRDSTHLQGTTTSIWENIKSTFNLQELRKNKDIFKILISMTLWGISFNIFFPYVIIYLNHNIGMDLINSSILMFIALFLSIVLSIPMGKIIDRVGRKKIAIAAIFGESIFLILFALTQNYVLLVFFGTAWVFFMMAFDISSQAWMKDLYPEGKAGQFSGLWIFFKVLLTMGPGSLIGGWISSKWGEPIILDGQAGFVPPAVLFIVTGVMILLTLIPIMKANEIKNEN